MNFSYKISGNPVMSTSTYLDLPQDSNSCTPDIYPEAETNSNNNSLHTPSNKRKRKKKQSLWSKGMVTKKAKVIHKVRNMISGISQSTYVHT